MSTELRQAAQQALNTLDEATTYTGSPSWSPSMTDECIAAASALRAILALRPERGPMTYEQIKTEFHRKQDELSEKGASANCPTDLIDFTVGIRFAEAHHGITAQAKKETP